MEGAVVEDIQYMNNSKGGVRHLRLTLAFGEYKWPALYWHAADKVGKEFDVGTAVDVAFRMGRNYFRNQESLQITVLDLKPQQQKVSSL